MAPGLKKIIEPTDEVFTASYARPSTLQQYLKTLQTQNEPKQKNFTDLKMYHFEDNANIIFNSFTLFHTKKRISQAIDIGLNAKVFDIENTKVKKYNGFHYAISLFWNHFQISMGENRFDDFSEFVPYISYENHYKKHNYLLEYTHQNGLFYTYSLCPYQRKIDTHHFSISDYIVFENNTDLWTNIQINLFSNANTNSIIQYDWRFFNKNINNNKTFKYDLALEGWYTTNTNQKSCFYSPKFADTTMLRIDPLYQFSKKLNIKTKIAAGYSFEDENIIYAAGIWFFGYPVKNLSYNLGCSYSNASKISFSKTNYTYTECIMDMGYKW